MTRVTFSPSTRSLYFYSGTDIYFVYLNEAYHMARYERTSAEELEELISPISDWESRSIFEWAELAPRV
jgi:hypothetical protein